MMSYKMLTGLALTGALATAALAPATGGAKATKAGSYKVSTTELPVFEQPAKVYAGVLVKGETFVVKKVSASGKYAYGKANGHVNKTGWVLSASLTR